MADWIARMEPALALLATRLDDPPGLAELAGAAAISPYHFHRLWRAMTGETVGATIARLRIATAQARLVSGGGSVTAVAMDGGYGTSQSFARAFRRVTGLSPTQFLSGGTVHAVPAPSDPAPVRIELRDACTLVALRQDGGGYRELNALFWQVWTWAEAADKIGGLQGIYGVPRDDPESVAEDRLRYDACLALEDPGVPPAPFSLIALPAADHAVLRHVGSYDGLEAANQRLIATILSMAREPADFPLYHHFLDDPEMVAEAELRTDILVRLVPAVAS